MKYLSPLNILIVVVIILAALAGAYLTVVGDELTTEGLVATPSTEAPITIRVQEDTQQADVKPLWESIVVDRETSETWHPQRVWDLPSQDFSTGDDDRILKLDPESAYWARFTIEPPQNSEADSHLLLPIAVVDSAYIWIRPSGDDWYKAAITGENYAKKSWTVYYTNHANVTLPRQHASVDVVVRVKNNNDLFLRMVWLTADQYYSSLLHFNRSIGACIGLASAVLILSVLSFLFMRRLQFASHGILCATVILYYMSISGVGVDAVLNSQAHLNTVSVTLASYLSLLAFLLVIASMTPKYRENRWVAWACGSLALAGIALTVWYYMDGYRVSQADNALAVYSILICLLGVFVPLTSVVRRKDRVSVWVLIGALLFVAYVVFIAIGRYYQLPKNTFLPISGVTFTLGVLVFFAAAYGRHRFGHTALSEQLVYNRTIDRLTGLLDRDGLMQVTALENLRQNKSMDPSSDDGSTEERKTAIMLVRLLEIEADRVEHLGQSVTDLAQIRLAYVLKNEFQTIPGGANIARVQSGCFVLFLVEPISDQKLRQHATRIVTQLLSMDDLPEFKSELGLQIVMDQEFSYGLSNHSYQSLYAYGNQFTEDPRVILRVGEE